MTILDPEALNAAVRDLNKQIGDAQQKLAAYESRKVLAAIRAAHDAAIEGGCGSARESAGPPWLADAAEALGKEGAALNWSQVISEIRDLVRRRQLDETAGMLVARTNERGEYCAEVDDLRRQLDALTRPIDGVEELAKYGLVEAGRGLAAIGRCEHAQAQAIASRVIGALRSAFVRIEIDSVDTMNPTAIFDAAVASLKIEPAKVEPKREADDAEQIDTRPVVKVGQVWTFDGNTEGPYTVGLIYRDYARTSKGEQFMRVAADGTPSHDGWRLISNTPTPKREPFELPRDSFESAKLTTGEFNEP